MYTVQNRGFYELLRLPSSPNSTRQRVQEPSMHLRNKEASLQVYSFFMNESEH